MKSIVGKKIVDAWLEEAIPFFQSKIFDALEERSFYDGHLLVVIDDLDDLSELGIYFINPASGGKVRVNIFTHDITDEFARRVKIDGIASAIHNDRNQIELHIQLF
jgi:hypothetical protein